MRKTVRERLQEAQQSEQQEQVTLTYDGLLERILGGPPNRTQLAFINDEATFKAYMGAAGVAKTSTICAAGLLRALLEPGSKGLVARADYNDLKGVTKQRMEEMLGRLPKGILLDRNKDAPETWWLRCADGEGVSQITFMGLNDEPMGHEFSWIAVDEAIEPEERHMRALRGRMRYMKGSRCMMLAFNPPDMNHWLYTACTGLDARGKQVQEPSFKLFVPAADENLRNLPAGYYEDLAKGLTEDMRERLVRGQWGAVFDTAPVYREYAPHIHQKAKLQFDTYSPLMRFWDFGYNHPVCLWAQMDDEGRIKVLHELMGEKEEIIPFARKVQGITAQKFKMAREVIDFGDPAARQRKDTGSTLTALGTVNITLIYSLHPSIEHGVQKVRMLLERLVRGEPAFQVDEKCMMLCRALRGGYRMDKSGQRPLKDDVYDHCCLVASSLVQTPAGEQPIASLKVGDLVTTPSGPAPISAVGVTNKAAKVFDLTVNGRTLTLTGNHPLLTQRGWVAVDALSNTDYLLVHEPRNHSRDVPEVQREEILPPSGQVLLGTGGIQQAGVLASGGVGSGERTYSAQNAYSSLERGHFGQPAGEFGHVVQLGARRSAYGGPGKESGVSQECCEVCGSGGKGMACERSRANLALGARQERLAGEKAAQDAMHHLLQGIRDCVSDADQILRAKLQSGELSATASWVRYARNETQEVWNLTVEGQHYFVAEGVVVHNCDALRYGIENLVDVDGTLLALPVGTALNGFQPQSRIPDVWAISSADEDKNYGF